MFIRELITARLHKILQVTGLLLLLSDFSNFFLDSFAKVNQGLPLLAITYEHLPRITMTYSSS